MSTKHPPERPNFSALEAAASHTVEQRKPILALIGDLNFSWSNTESVFIYVLMLLLETDDVSAAIVFSTLNTTRSRLDLIQRLARAKLQNTDTLQDLEKIIIEFSKVTATRNDLNHATFVFNAKGEITHTQSLKLQEKRGKMQFGSLNVLDDKRIAQIGQVVQDVKSLNRKIWNILPKLDIRSLSLPRACRAPIS